MSKKLLSETSMSYPRDRTNFDAAPSFDAVDDLALCGVVRFQLRPCVLVTAKKVRVGMSADSLLQARLYPVRDSSKRLYIAQNVTG